MASLEDVLNTLTTQISAYVYPNGTGQPSVTGNTIKIYPGWPTSSSLDQDLQSEITNVTIYPSGPENNVTRYRPKQNVMSVATPTLTLTASVNVVTVGGAMPSPFTPHNLAVLINGQPFIYPVQSSDTLTSIATGLASLIAAQYPATSSSGPNITINDADLVFTATGLQVVSGQGNPVIANLAPVSPTTTRVGTTGVVTTEWERYKQRMQITVWAQDPTTRGLVAAAIRTGFAQISFLTMPDGFGARVRSNGSALSDVLEKAKTYRRDLFYEVEYATTVTQQIATVVAAQVAFETQTGVPIITRTY
jgi:hypothetical protein